MGFNSDEADSPQRHYKYENTIYRATIEQTLENNK